MRPTSPSLCASLLLLVACPPAGGESTDSASPDASSAATSSTSGAPTTSLPTTGGPGGDPTGGPGGDPTGGPGGDPTGMTGGTGGTTDTGGVPGVSQPLPPGEGPLIVWVDPGPGGLDPYIPLWEGPTWQKARELASKHKGKLKGLANGLLDWGACVQEQGDAGQCARDVVWAGMCNFAIAKLTERMSPGMQMIGMPFEAMCNGDPVLKCCKYTGSDSCHSAYNSDMPINCEGNPMGGESFGPCIGPEPWDIFGGCTCAHLPECSGGEGDGFDDPLNRFWRLDGVARDLANALADVALADPEGFYDYSLLRGTRDHFDGVLGLAPFAGDDQLPPGMDGSPKYHENDGDPRARYRRALYTTALRRTLGGVPGALARWDYLALKTWEPAAIAAHLQGVDDPDAVLLEHLGPFGLALAKATYPDTYVVLAAPAPGEVADPKDDLYHAGVEAGAPAELSFQTSDMDAGTVALALALTDPQAADNPDGMYLVGIDWGDDVFEGVPFVTADAATHTATHAYEQPGTYTIQAFVANTSGHVSGATSEWTLAAGSGVPVARSIAAIRLDVAARIEADTHGHVSVDVHGRDLHGFDHPLDRYWTQATGPAKTVALAPFTARVLAHDDRVPLTTLTLTSVHEGAAGVEQADLLLSGVTVDYYTSPGNEPLSVTHGVDALVVTVGDDPPVAVPQDPNTQAFLLPLPGAARVVLP
jgi:hypothetical protein